jgi:hypothetical protein
MLVSDWKLLYSEVMDLEPPARLGYRISSIAESARSANPSSARRILGRSLGLAGLCLGGAAILGLLALAAHSRDDSAPHAGTATAPTHVTGAVFVNGGPTSTSYHLRDAHAKITVGGTTTSGDPLTLRLTADKKGRFAVNLPPGRYVASAWAYVGLPLRKQPHYSFTIPSSRASDMRVVIVVEAK